MRIFQQIHRKGFVPAWLFLVATLVGTTSATAVDPAGEIEARVRQIYFEGYPVTASGPLGSVAVERLGEMLRDPTEEPYWSNIVLALGASENPGAYRHLADFTELQPSGEVSSAVYQAWVSLPVALGQLAYSYPPALVTVEKMARDVRLDPGWRFQSLEGASLARAMRRSAITGLAVSGRPEAAGVLTDLEAHNRKRAEAGDRAAADHIDGLLQHIEFARTLHRQVVSDGPASVLGRGHSAQSAEGRIGR